MSKLIHTRRTRPNKTKRRVAIASCRSPVRPHGAPDTMGADGSSAPAHDRGIAARLPTPVERPVFEPGHPRYIPTNWPALLSRDQLCAYLGVSAATLTHICSVHPLELGANLVRFSREQIDDWVATLPPRLMSSHNRRGSGPAEAKESAGEHEADSRTESALDRVRARAGGSSWKTG